MGKQRSESYGADSVLNVQPNSLVSVAYHHDFGAHEELLLMELDEKLLPDVLSQRVSFRGQLEENSVLCTKSKTYSIKFVGTSNSVFLIPPSQLLMDENAEGLSDEKEDGRVIAPVYKVAPGNMELIEIAPRLDRLKLLLSENHVGISEMSESEMVLDRDEGCKVLYSWEDLVELVQASDDELRSGLEALSAVEINGYWRILDDKFIDYVLTMLLHNSVLADWSLDALRENQVTDMLESDGVPRSIAAHCLRVYGSRVNEDLEMESVWKLDERKVCVHFAQQVLKDGEMKMEKFMEEWIRKIPSGMHGSLDMLQGEILMEKIGIETWVRSFSVSSLPLNPAERFSILFKVRPKWEWKDLEPFIRDLKVPGLSSEGLLLKYTRRTQPSLDVEPIFSAR
ncbi:hypothetical protein Droror1_Dr00011726 [Drosera rotundifolia]